MQVNKIISQHLLLPKRFILSFGINPTVLLMELIDKELYHIKHDSIWADGYFYHSKEYVFENTALPRGKFDTARKKLEEQDLIFTKLGKWKKLHFRINNEKINQIFYPKNQEMWDMNLSLEPFMDESYIRYPIALAHTIGINETILIKDLLSKRQYFLKKWELKNGYFYNSVKNILEDTTLTKKQQLKSIKVLESFNLVDVQLDYDNTRYFCLNLEWIIQYENLDLKKVLNNNESKKSTKVESKKSTIWQNPFEIQVSEKSFESKSWKSSQLESEKNHDQKEISALGRTQKSYHIERKKGNINKEQIIKSNNNIKQMKLLLLDLNFWNEFIEYIFENFELLNISICLVKFQNFLKNSNSQNFQPVEKMKDLLAENENLIHKFYNLHIYEENIISETLINFSRSDIEIMFESIQKWEKKSVLSQIKNFLKNPLKKNNSWEISVENQIENLIDVQVQKWIANNEEDYEVMLQQEQIEILEANPLEENPLEKAKNIIRNFIISKKLKL